MSGGGRFCQEGVRCCQDGIRNVSDVDRKVGDDAIRVSVRVRKALGGVRNMKESFQTVSVGVLKVSDGV